MVIGEDVSIICRFAEKRTASVESKLSKSIKFDAMKKCLLIAAFSYCCSTLILAQTTDTTKVSPPVETTREIFKVVEDKPSFPGCEANKDKSFQATCAEEKMFEFIYANLKYPISAQEKGVQGKVYIKFIVEKDGTITNAEIVRDIGEGCGEEGLRLVKMMPKWNPGKQRGKPVVVQFNLPISFALANGQPVKPNIEEMMDANLILQSATATEDAIYKKTAEAPVFWGCNEHSRGSGLSTKCSDGNMKRFIRQEMKYPKIAKKNDIEGTVKITAVIEKDGSLSHEAIQKDIGWDCGEEALRIVKLMPKWTPATHRGKPVRVQVIIPVEFVLK